MNKVAAAVLVLGLAACTAWAQGPPYRIDGVHADINVSYVNGAWQPRVTLDFPLPQYDFLTSIPADQALLRVKPNSTTVVTQPANPNFNFIGAGAGKPFLRLSQNSLTPHQLFLGLETTNMNQSAPGNGWANWNPLTVPINPSTNPGAPNLTTKFVELIITDIRAPAEGHFSVWFTSGGVPRVYTSTFERGYTNSAGQNSLFVPINGHVHFNWGFTQLGKYEIDIVARTFYFDHLGALTELRSDPNNPFTFTFDVSKEHNLALYLNPVIDFPVQVEPVGHTGAGPGPVPFAPIPEPTGAIMLLAATLLRRWCKQAGESRRVSRLLA